MRDPEDDAVRRHLHTPAAAFPGQIARRRFLQGSLAAGAGVALLPSWMDHLAAAASPIGAHDGVLVVVQLGGGNDGLSLLSPRQGHADHGRYRDARGNLAVAGSLPLAADLGLHPGLPRLKARWDAGQVAIVQGVGQAQGDLSHFTSTETWMAGTGSGSRTTGWLGRWLDGIPDAAGGLRAVTVGSDVPLHVRGERVAVTGLSAGSEPFGSVRTQPYMSSVYDAIVDLGQGTTGRGRLADLAADAGASSIGLAERLAPVVGGALPPGILVRNLSLAADLVNADLGIRVLTCVHRDYDLHTGLAYTYGRLMEELDLAIESFFTRLQPSFRDRVALMTFSEFGRRVAANDSHGTGHGTSAPQLVVGANVEGGLHGMHPRLDQLDSRGNPRVEVDLRSYYASIVDGWLAGGSSTILGGTYEDLHLFRRSPGGPSTPPPPIDTAWRPFPDPATLIRQQYIDFLGRPADAAGVSYWVGKLLGGSTISWVVNAFLGSPEFGAAVAPAARLALACLGDPPAFSDLMAWAERVRRRDPLAAVAADVVTRPAFTTRYGSLANRTFVDRAHRDATGVVPTGSWGTAWAADQAARLGDGRATRADVMATIVALPAAAAFLRVRVEVTMTYAGLLRRAPEPSGYAFWVAKGDAGTSIQRLVEQFFASAEYHRRFT